MPIRPATIADARTIAEVHISSWRSAYRGILPDAVLDGLRVENREQMWTDVLTNRADTHFVWVDEEDGQIVGFALGGPAQEDAVEGYDGELYTIYLLKEVQGRGIGRLLTYHVARSLHDAGYKNMLVWVLEENHPSRRFYEALGAHYLTSKQVTIAGEQYMEVAYGWTDLSSLAQ